MPLDALEITADTFTVVARTDPFHEAVTEFQCRRGATITEAIALLPGRRLPNTNYVVWIGPHEIEPALFGKIRPNAGTTLYLKAVVSEPISAAIIGTTILGSTFAASVAASVLTALVTSAVGFLLNMLFAPSPPEITQRPKEATVYNIRGARNRPSAYGVVPRPLGKSRFVPPYGAMPYTEIVGNDQYLRILVVWGYGPLQVTDIKVGDTLLTSYTDYEIETIPGDSGTNVDSVLYPNIARQEDLSVELRMSAFSNYFGFTQALDNKANPAKPIKSFEFDPVDVPGGDLTFNIRLDYGSDTAVTVPAASLTGGTDGTNAQSVLQTALNTALGGGVVTVGLDAGEITLIAVDTTKSITLEDTNITGFYSTRTTPVDTDEIGVTLTWAAGLYSVGKRGGVNPNSVDVTIEYSPTGAGTWTSIASAETVSAATAQPYRRSWRVSGLTRGTFDVRIKTDNPQWKNQPNHRYDATWTALRSFQNEDPITLDGMCYSVIRIKATDQLNGVLDQINGIVEAEIPIYSGGNWTTAVGYSRNPADIFRFVLTGAQNAKALAASAVDDVRLAEWWSYCDTNNYTFGHVIDYEVGVRDLLVQIAQAGRASVSVVDGLWGVIIDKAKTTIAQHFTPRNSWDFSGQRLFPDQPHALRVRFVNELEEYQVDERIVYDDGYTSGNATLFESMEFTGVQDPDHAYQLAREFLAIARLRPEIFTFKVDLEHLICIRGDRIRLSHDVPMVGTAYGRVTSVAGAVIGLDQEVTMTAGPVYHLLIRYAADNTNEYLVVPTVAGTSNSVTVTLGTAPAVGDLFMFGVQTSVTEDLIVHSLTPGDDLTATIEAVPYAAAVFDAATSIPTYTSVLSAAVTRAYDGPALPVISAVRSGEDQLIQTANGDVLASILVQFRPGSVDPAAVGNRATTTESYRVRWRESGTDVAWRYSPLLLDTTSFTVTGVVTHGTYDIGVQAIDHKGATSSWTEELSHIVTGASAPPEAVDNISIKNVGPFTYVEWAYVNPPIDLAGFELRHHEDIDVVNWAQMQTVGELLPRLARSVAVPARPGTYAIKSIDVLGTRSLLGVFATSSNADPERFNELARVAEDPSFSGTKTLVSVSNSTIRLTDTAGVFPDEGFYQFANDIDLTRVLTARVSPLITSGVDGDFATIDAWTPGISVADPLAGGLIIDNVALEFQVATSADDTGSPTYGSWQPLSASGEYTARHFKFRVRMTSISTDTTPTIAKLGAVLDAEDRFQTGDDIVMPSAAPYTVTLSPAYHVLKSVTVTLQDAVAGDYLTVTSKSRTGFTISAFDALGNPAARTFDYIAVGYGREKGT